MKPTAVRLREYAASLLSTAEQMRSIGDLPNVDPTGALDDGIAQLRMIGGDLLDIDADADADVELALRDRIRLFRIVADDLEKIASGEELRPFVVTGTLPTTRGTTGDEEQG